VEGGAVNRPCPVCGWFTPNYRPWTDKLIASLNALGIPHDVVEVPRLPGSWEANTMAKPAQILAAMDRHPERVVVFLDVDCEVKAPIDGLASITGDAGFYVRTRYRRFGGIRFGARSGTVVIRPTAAARAYIEAWTAAARQAPRGSVDQAAQMVAMGPRALVQLHDAGCRVLRHGRGQGSGADHPARQGERQRQEGKAQEAVGAR